MRNVQQGAYRSAAPTADSARSTALHLLVTISDAVCLLAAWSAATLAGPPVAAPAAVVLGAAGAGMAQLRASCLHRARGCTMRTAELGGVVRVACISACGGWVTSAVLRGRLPSSTATLGAGGSFALLALLRSTMSSAFRRRRASGRGLWRVLIAGTNAEAAEVAVLLRSRPELGYRIAGVVGPRPSLDGALPDVPWLGTTDEAVEIATALQVTGIVTATNALPRAEMEGLVAAALDAKVHVQISSGVGRISHRRLRRSPVGHDPWIYIERNHTGWSIEKLKRAMDLTLAVIFGILALPGIAAAALAIKLEDGGPVLFRQPRVGRDGKTFTCLKLRTMVVGAEDERATLDLSNIREGPLFKAAADPRVTRAGRYLRASSLDELPQLWNVLRHEMSIVGPRPALPSEVELFDSPHRSRSRVLPGITGLWQVEARDNPSFDVYRQLDLFYIENRSLALDLSIVAMTVPTVLGRLWRTLPGHHATAQPPLDRPSEVATTMREAS